MGMGSYKLGATARIVLQVTEGGIAETSSISPTITSLIKPNKTVDGNFPVTMVEADSDYGTYYYDYIPADVGDYMAIITYTVDGTEYTTLEHFTVYSNSRGAPRAESR
jgi:hypothetical protein